MPTAVQLALFTIVTTVQVVLGLSMNSCIVVFNFKSLKNEPTINAGTLIYLAMGLVNVFMQLLFLAQNVLSVFWVRLFFTSELALSVIVLSLVFMICSFWLVGWLCAYYCVSIVSSRQQIMVVLRRVLSSFLPRILLLTAVGAIFLCVPSIWMMDFVLQMQPQTNSTLETSITEIIILGNPVYTAVIVFLGCFLPFTLAVICTGVTTFSLIRHMNKMKHNVSGFTRPNIQTLIKATRTMVLFLTCSIIFYGFTLMYFASKKSTSDSVTQIGWFMIMCFPSAEALLIIQAIAKLRKALLDKLCFWKENNSETYNDT